MRKTKKGRCVKKNKQQQEELEELVQAPHTFVIHRGLSGEYLLDITKDFRKVMEPFTASSLKERKKNTIKDFVSIAGILHVSHMCIFTRTEQGMNFKIGKLPRGPTLTFKMHNFSLCRDVISSLKKQFFYEELFKNAPLIVLNNFSGEGMHLKLIATTFQNMFPTINLTTVDLNTIRRCVLLSYNATTKLIDFRHYAIKIIPLGISKGVKKIVQGKIPNLSRCGDISELLTRSGALSESEFEDDPNSEVTLPQKMSSRGLQESGKSAIRLSELGPRLTIQLIKVENGLLDGEVLFHEFIQKTDEEIAAINKKREQKRKLKKKRKRQQELNIKKKQENKELKQKCSKDMKKDVENEKMKKVVKEASEAVAEDDDAEYYRQEVGEEPDHDLFTSGNRKRSLPPKPYKSKNQKLDDQSDAFSQQKMIKRKFKDSNKTENRDIRAKKAQNTKRKIGRTKFPVGKKILRKPTKSHKSKIKRRRH